MAKNAKKKPPEEILAFYTALIETIPGLKVKGVSTGYTSHNGHMFTFLSNDGELGIRLPMEVRKKFIKNFKTELFVQYGKLMREYVEVPENLIKETETLQPYLAASYEYIKTLKPK